MTVQAQNALLKTLEEPPEYGVIILMTSSLGSAASDDPEPVRAVEYASGT